MTREEKINLLKGFANGTRSLNELQIKYDLFICDTDKLVKIGIDKKDIVTQTEFNQLESQGLIKGIVINMNTFSIYQYN